MSRRPTIRHGWRRSTDASRRHLDLGLLPGSPALVDPCAGRVEWYRAVQLKLNQKANRGQSSARVARLRVAWNCVGAA